MSVGQNMIYRQTNGIGSQINNCVFDRSHLLTEKYMRCLFLLFLFYQIYVKSKRKFVSNLCEIVVIGKDFFGTIRMAGSGFGYCSFVNDVRPEKAKEFCLWRIDFSDGGRA